MARTLATARRIALLGIVGRASGANRQEMVDPF
jgi:hypothetical protein